MITLSRTLALGFSIFAVAACSGNESEDSTDTADADRAAVTAVGNTFAGESASTDVRSSGAAPAGDTGTDFTKVAMSQELQSFLAARNSQEHDQTLTVGEFTCKRTSVLAPPRVGLRLLGVAKVVAIMDVCSDAKKQNGLTAHTVTTYNRNGNELFTYHQRFGGYTSNASHILTTVRYGNSTSDSLHIELVGDDKGKKTLPAHINANKLKNKAVIAAIKQELGARGIRTTKHASSACVGAATGLGGSAISAAGCLLADGVTEGVISPETGACVAAGVAGTSSGIYGTVDSCKGS